MVEGAVLTPAARRRHPSCGICSSHQRSIRARCSNSPRGMPCLPLDAPRNSVMTSSCWAALRRISPVRFLLACSSNAGRARARCSPPAGRTPGSRTSRSSRWAAPRGRAAAAPARPARRGHRARSACRSRLSRNGSPCRRILPPQCQSRVPTMTSASASPRTLPRPSGHQTEGSERPTARRHRTARHRWAIAAGGVRDASPKGPAPLRRRRDP